MPITERSYFRRFPLGREKAVQGIREVDKPVYKDLGMSIVDRFTVNSETDTVTVNRITKEADLPSKMQKPSVKEGEDINGPEGKGLVVQTSKRRKVVFRYVPE